MTGSCRMVATYAVFWCVAAVAVPTAHAQQPPVDLSGYRADSGVAVSSAGNRLTLEWPMEEERGRLILDLTAGHPLIASMSVGTGDGRDFRPVLEAADPECFLLVGSRSAPEGRPPGMSIFNVFFDAPAKRPFDSYRAQLDLKRVRVKSTGRVVTVAIGNVSAGPFSGDLSNPRLCRCASGSSGDGDPN